MLPGAAVRHKQRMRRTDSTKERNGRSSDGGQRNPGAPFPRSTSLLASGAASARRSERFAHALGIARDHGEVRARRLVRLDAALFPIAQGANRNAVSCGKFFLAQPEGAADDFLAG